MINIAQSEVSKDLFTSWCILAENDHILVRDLRSQQQMQYMTGCYTGKPFSRFRTYLYLQKLPDRSHHLKQGGTSSNIKNHFELITLLMKSLAKLKYRFKSWMWKLFVNKIIFVAFVEDNGTMSLILYFEIVHRILCKLKEVHVYPIKLNFDMTSKCFDIVQQILEYHGLWQRSLKYMWKRRPRNIYMWERRPHNI